MVRKPTRRGFTRLAGTLAGIAALGGAATADSSNRRPRPPGSLYPDPGEREEPALVAHRCFAGVYPENTLASMEGASTVREGATPYTLPSMVEIDLMPTQEGTVVVFHDDELSGLTDESGVVWLSDDETVLNAEVLRSGQTIPTLREALETIPAWMPVQLDLKNPGTTAATDPSESSESARWRSFVADILEVTESFAHDYLWSAFFDDALWAVRELAPDDPILYLWIDDNERGYQSAERLDAEVVGPSIDVVDRNLVERAHADGREVNVFTATAWHEAEHLRRLNVDGMISDFPRLWDFGRSQALGE